MTILRHILRFLPICVFALAVLYAFQTPQTSPTPAVTAQKMIPAAPLQSIDPPAPAEGQGSKVDIRVIDAANGGPLPGVTISLNRQPIITNAQQADRRRWGYMSSKTDPQGKSSIVNIFPDRYSIDPKLGGYVLSTDSDRSVTLESGKSASTTLRMWRCSAVEGVVQDRDGKLVPDANIQLLQENWAGGTQTFSFLPTVRTDTDGKFSFPKVLPGPYFLRAIPNQGMVQQQLRESDQDQTGKKPVEEKHVAYVATFFPGSPILAGATPIQVFAGTDQSGVLIQMQKSKYFAFSGRVEGMPPGARGMLGLYLHADPNSVAFFSPPPFSPEIGVALAPDGSFSTPSVPPGSYYGGYAPAGEVRGGNAFEIVDRDVTDYRAALTKGLTLSAKVVYDDGKPVSAMLAHMAVQFGGSVGLAGYYVRDASVNPQGELKTSGLPEGKYRLEFPNAAVVRKIEIDGRTTTNGEFELRSEGSNVVITASASGATITGTVEFDERVKSYPRGVITVTPAPQRPTDAPRRKRLDGGESFSMEHLPEGSYRVCAWVEEGADLDRVLGNPNFERRLASYCQSVDLGWDDSKAVHLKQISAADFR